MALRKEASLKPWAIALIVVCSVLLLPWIIQLIVVRSLKRRARKTEGFLMSKLRYIVYVTGQVGAGKTTFGAGYTNLRTKYLMEKAVKRIEFTCLAFPQIDFSAVDGILTEDFRTEIDSAKEAKKLISKDMPLAGFQSLAYDNHVSPHPVPFLELLEGYIDAFWALLRNNYVYYYGKNFYSQVTFTDAMDYDPSMLAIKDRESDYHMLPYSVIFEDEKQLGGHDNQFSRSYAKADTGTSDFLRLIRQIGQESIYYITTNQYWGTDINRERELATEIVCMDESTAVNPFFMMRFLIACYELPFKVVRHFASKHPKAQVSSLEKRSGYRRNLSRAMLWRKRWASKGYVVFKGTIYHSASDVGKLRQNTAKGMDRMYACIPLRYCYGSINTFAFYAVQRELMSRTKWKLSDEPKAVTDEDIARRVLMKNEAKIKGDRRKPGTRKAPVANHT